MLLRIVSSEGELYHGEVQKVLLPTQDGFLGIFPGHVNLVTPLCSGSITYLPQNIPMSTLEQFADHDSVIKIGGGLAMIENNIITIASE